MSDLERKNLGVVHIRGISTDTKINFAANCIRHKQTLQNVIERMMLHYTNHPQDVLIPNLPRTAWNGTLFFRCIKQEVYVNFKATCRQRVKPLYLVVEGLMRLYNSNPERFKVHHRIHKKRNERKYKREIEDERQESLHQDDHDR